MMNKRTDLKLKDNYLQWLESQLTDEPDSSKKYWGLLQLMFDTPFTWIDPMDENRAVDGIDLRVEFAHQNHINPKTMAQLGECSFLEVLIGLSRRLAFTAGGSAEGWAWQLLNNLELHRMTDPLTRSKQHRAEEIMRVAMDRTYLPDGTGGFFPLTDPDGDQTTVELWYQMNSFIEELHPEHT